MLGYDVQRAVYEDILTFCVCLLVVRERVNLLQRLRSVEESVLPLRVERSALELVLESQSPLVQCLELLWVSVFVESDVVSFL